MTLSTKPAMTAAIESPALSLRSLPVNSVIAAAADRGRNRIIQGSKSGFMLELHRREIFDVCRLAFAVKRDDEGKAYANFRGGDRDDKEHKDLAVEIVVEARERHQGEVSRVEHQFQPHVNDEQIAS